MIEYNRLSVKKRGAHLRLATLPPARDNKNFFPRATKIFFHIFRSAICPHILCPIVCLSACLFTVSWYGFDEIMHCTIIIHY